MFTKQILASTLLLSLMSPVAFAENGWDPKHPVNNVPPQEFKANSASSSIYSNTVATTQPATTEIASSLNDDMALRGHLTALPKGTMMMVKLDQPVSSFSGKVGDAISGVVESDVYVDNQVAIPAGSQALGSVTGISGAGHMGKSGSIEVQFDTIKTTSGTTIPIRAHIVTSDNSGVIKGDSTQAQVLKSLGSAAVGAGAGTLMGTAAGSILGSAGTGATFGLAAGSLVGVGYAIIREGKQVVLPSGARMSIVLDQPVGIN